jgi:hypothetical protein
VGSKAEIRRKENGEEKAQTRGGSMAFRGHKSSNLLTILRTWEAS